jgi:PGF-CTERM protein
MVMSVFAVGAAFSGAAAANATGLTGVGNQDTVGEEFTVTVNLDNSDGETVTVENIVDGEVVDTVSATDGSTNDADGAEDGSIDVTLTAGKTYGGASEVVVTDNNGNEFSDTYNTSNYLVTLDDGTVTQGETSTIYGSIYEYPGELVDETVDYSLQYDPDIGNQVDDSNETVLASSDTGNGEFQVRRTFDEVDEATGFLNDYPTDGATVDASNQPSYVVYVAENATSDADGDSSIEPADYMNDGHAQIDTRLNVEGELSQNGTIVEMPNYRDTIDVVNGMVSNANGGLGSYALRVEDPTGSTQKTTQSAQDGSFGFTLEMNDAGTWNLGTNEGAFIGYQDITVAPQTADLEFTATGDNLATFQEEYSIQLNDSLDGYALNTEAGDDTSTDQGHVQGYINVTGPFEDSVDWDDDNTDETLISQNSVIAVGDDNASDGVVEYIHVATDDNGAAAFDAVPTQNADVTATLELQSGETYTGLEEAHDAADSPTEPDYTASAPIPLGGASPVNIVDEAVEDPQTANADANNGDFAGTYTNILTDSGPSIVDVLPLANTTGERINNGLRFGNDVNQNLEGMTVYRVTFELRNDTNEPIAPNAGSPYKFNHMEINGAGLNATLYADDSFEGVSVDSRNGNVYSANHFDVDGDGRDEYMFLMRPTSTDEPDEQIVHEIHVGGQEPVEFPLDAAGLSISEFQVDGEETNSIRGDQNISLTSTVQAPYDNNAPVNNGLVRLIQTGPDYDLDTETDARTSNVNDGEYTFENISLGPRGIDSDNNGVAESISQLVFTAYQYTDENLHNQALERQEVDRAAVRTVELAPDSSLQVEFLPENTSMYSGFKPNEFGETFTLTKGVEYHQIAFNLTTESGEPVDLTEGIGGQEVGLNQLADATVSGEHFVKIVGASQDDNQVAHEIHFNESASNATAGYYVIDDIEEASNYIGSESAAASAGDAFGFNDNSARDLDTFQLQVMTPDASYTTNESTQGYFNAEEPSIDTEILGVNVNETTLETFGVDHDTSDEFTEVSDVDNMTVGIDRWYRVRGQVTDALGTPINGTMLDASHIQYVEDGAFSDQPDRADVHFINGWDNNNAYRNDFGNDNSSNSTTFNDNMAGIELNNESGYVLYDINPTHPDDDGSFTPQYSLFAHTSESHLNFNTFPQAYWQDTPLGQLPRVQVYDQSGALLPNETGNRNQILANDVTQTLRIEAFPADSNDFPAPQLRYAVDSNDDPVAENAVNTLTNLQDDSVLVTDNDAPYPNVPYEQGQVGYLTLTPTGTGDGIIQLLSGSASGPITQSIDGEDIEFDVLRSNKQVDFELSEGSITPGSTVNATVTSRSTGEPIALAQVALEDTNGNVIATNTTNQNGVTSITIPESAQLGQYSMFTRPAGYQPVTTSFEVSSPAQLDEDLELVAQEGQVISGTTSAEEGTYTIEIEGPGLLESADAEVQDDGTFSAEFDLSSLSAGDEVTATIAGVDSVTYTLQSPPTSTITMNPQVSQNGDVVTVSEVFLPEGGYVVIHNASTGDVIGASGYFDAGTYEDVDVLLDQNLAGGQNTVIAMSHKDTNGNEVYEFGDVDGADGPYTANGEQVTDSAQVSVSSPPPTPTTEPPTTEPTTQEPTDTTEEPDGDTGDGDGPGFGIAVALVALLGAALLAVRRNN